MGNNMWGGEIAIAAGVGLLLIVVLVPGRWAWQPVDQRRFQR
jgi:hypothetical protein